MDIDLIRALVTLVSLVLFVGIAYWAFRPRNRKHFEQAARIPLDSDSDSDGPEGGRR